MHRDLLFGEFGGGTPEAKAAVYTAASTMATKISPNTGDLDTLLQFRDMMAALYSDYYADGGIITARIAGDGQTSGELTIPRIHEFETPLDLDLDRGAPINVTQQEDWGAIIVEDDDDDEPEVVVVACADDLDEAHPGYGKADGEDCWSGIGPLFVPPARSGPRYFDEASCGCKCPSGTHFVPYNNPHGLGTPGEPYTPAGPSSATCAEDDIYSVLHYRWGVCMECPDGQIWSSLNCKCTEPFVATGGAYAV